MIILVEIFEGGTGTCNLADTVAVIMEIPFLSESKDRLYVDTSSGSSKFKPAVIGFALLCYILIYYDSGEVYCMSFVILRKDPELIITNFRLYSTQHALH